MADPACKTCKHFDPNPFDGNSGECMDRTKRIYPRKTAPSEVEPPSITHADTYTCLNHDSGGDDGQNV